MKRSRLHITFIVLQVELMGLLMMGCATQDIVQGEMSPGVAEEPPVLFKLVEEGTPEAIKEAIRAGADVNARVDVDKVLVRPPYRNFGKVLVEAPSWDDGAVLMWAAFCNENPEVIEVLLDAGAEVNARSNRGYTALMCAAWRNKNPEVFRVLLEAGADVNARDKTGMTPLILAAIRDDNLEVIRVFLEAGAHVNARTRYDRTALMSAAIGSVPEVIHVLLEADAYVNAQDRNGRTALMEAARSNGYSEVIELLLEAGADARAKDSSGKTAWDYVQCNRYLKLTKASRRLKKATFE